MKVKDWTSQTDVNTSLDSLNNHVSIHSLLIRLTDTNGLMKFIDRFQQFSMHHIYNDIFHQAAVSQSLSKIRLNILSFCSTSYTRGPGDPLRTMWGGWWANEWGREAEGAWRPSQHLCNVCPGSHDNTQEKQLLRTLRTSPEYFWEFWLILA